MALIVRVLAGAGYEWLRGGVGHAMQFYVFGVRQREAREGIGVQQIGWEGGARTWVRALEETTSGVVSDRLRNGALPTWWSVMTWSRAHVSFLTQTTSLQQGISGI